MWQKNVDGKFLGLLHEKGVCCHCHGIEKPPIILCYSHSQECFLWGNFVADDKYVFKNEWKFKDEYEVHCFIFVWRRMVDAMELVEVTQLQKGFKTSS